MGALQCNLNPNVWQVVGYAIWLSRVQHIVGSSQQFLRQPKGDLRVNYQDHDGETHKQEEWHRVFGNLPNRLLRQSLNDEQVKPNRWSNLSQFNHYHQKDAKPDWVPPGLYGDRQGDWKAHDDDGNTVQKQSQNDIK